MKSLRVFIAFILIFVLTGCSSDKKSEAVRLNIIKMETTESPEIEPMSDRYKKDIGVKKPFLSPKESNKPAVKEFDFVLPKGYIDDEGNIHNSGKMRLATDQDEKLAMQHPAVQSNPAYEIVVLLSRVVTDLGTLPDINPEIIENLFSSDFAYLQEFYNSINTDYTQGSAKEQEKEPYSQELGLSSGYLTYEFTLPKGIVDEDGDIVKDGIMRLATAADEILPLQDPRVQADPAYLSIIILSRVVISLGDNTSINTDIIESLCASDFSYLLEFYNAIN